MPEIEQADTPDEQPKVDRKVRALRLALFAFAVASAVPDFAGYYADKVAHAPLSMSVGLSIGLGMIVFRISGIFFAYSAARALTCDNPGNWATGAFFFPHVSTFLLALRTFPRAPQRAVTDMGPILERRREINRQLKAECPDNPASACRRGEHNSHLRSLYGQLGIQKGSRATCAACGIELPADSFVGMDLLQNPQSARAYVSVMTGIFGKDTVTALPSRGVPSAAQLMNYVGQFSCVACAECGKTLCPACAAGFTEAPGCILCEDSAPEA